MSGRTEPHSEETKRKMSLAQREKNMRLFEQGLLKERSTLKYYLIETRGYKCAVAECGLSEWLGKPITLQVNHKDGNASNNLPENLELICPNCHSQTDTWGAKNKGNGRLSRGMKLHS